MSDSLQPHGLQHARLPCPSLSSRTCSKSCPLSQWCHSTISSSVVLFSSCLFFPSIRVFSSESALPIRWQKYWSFSISPSDKCSGWFPLGLPFHHRGLECKSRKSRNTWSNRQVCLWNKKWSRAKANRVLPREYTGHSRHPLPTTQEKTLHMDITRWSILKPDWFHSLKPVMEKLYKVSKNKTGSWLWLTSWIPHCQIQT